MPHLAGKLKEQPKSSSVDHSVERKQRDLSPCKVEKTWRVPFTLLQCEEVHDTYILEMHKFYFHHNVPKKFRSLQRGCNLHTIELLQR
ncbi:hypothetical protein Pfo_026898 [Paulownia fortunei]|nr:hypothetical protein Pfo_026898 [Paulownia fortunei]